MRLDPWLIAFQPPDVACAARIGISIPLHQTDPDRWIQDVGMGLDLGESHRGPLID